MDTSGNEICIVDSYFYLALTPMPVKERFGDAMVLFNHKTGLVAPLDAKGLSYLEPGGIYTSEDANSDMVKNATVSSNIYDRRQSDTSEKSFFKGFLSSKSPKRTTMGLLPSKEPVPKPEANRRSTSSLQPSKSSSNILEPGQEALNSTHSSSLTKY